jgi:uncharacterized membrane protein
MLIGLIWTVVTAFKMGGTLWGVLNILLCLQPIVGIVSAIMKKAAWLPVIIMVIGSILYGWGMYPTIVEMMRQGATPAF